MSCDAGLEARIDGLSVGIEGLDKRRMFGGVGYLLRGHMAYGIWRDNLVLRCGPAAYAECLKREGVREFDVTGRPMKGWVLVSAAAIAADTTLDAWLAQGRTFAASLPPKA